MWAAPQDNLKNAFHLLHLITLVYRDLSTFENKYKKKKHVRIRLH